MASMTNMFPAAAAVISGINLLNIFTNVILQDYRPKKQSGRSTSPRKRSIGENSHALPVPAYGGSDFTPERAGRSLLTFRAGTKFRAGEATGVNSRLYESVQHDIFGGVMATNTQLREGTAPVRKSLRYHVKTFIRILERVIYNNLL